MPGMSRVKHIVYHFDDINSVADRITILNFIPEVHCVLMSCFWYRSILSFNMLDACCFDIVVYDDEYRPFIPIAYEFRSNWL